MSDAGRFYDALIVGAGPCGLMTACQLAMRNISFAIVDKNVGFSNYSGALFIHAWSLEAFEQMGIAAQAIQQGAPIDRVEGYYDGKRILNANIRKMGRGQTKFPFVLALEQGKTESLLASFLEEKGML